ncbi:HEPN domain-containing protein [Patescibacteria group bacterium]|nr:HEPN domain-containing protein [Candidatus Omnitrophota bacterium]MBU1685678.1 HEPN domain-containing protein [Patescibacteria group bacterium]MBU1784286.1 HEPN domain-containing protein [Candidatus Omnitrophota bacterium]MBU1851104.1 HEPN domain-containing protein [Candidatus Omnitrophota bacterium]
MFKKIDVGNLSYFAVEIRYPDQFYMPSKKEADESLEIAKKIKELVLRKLEINKDEIT